MSDKEIREKVAYLERQEDFWKFCLETLDEKLIKFADKLIEVVNEHLQDEKSHYYNTRQTERIKELEAQLTGLTKYLYEKIEEVMSKKRKHYKY